MTNQTQHNTNKKVAAAINDGEEITVPASKRQRVYVACEYCRLKKQKCDSKRPSCSSCIALNQQCVYGAGVKKRGLPPGYVRILETLLGLVVTRVSHGESAILRLLSETGESLKYAALGKHEESTDEALQNFKKSNVLKLIENLLDGNQSQLDAESQRSPTTGQHDLLDWHSYVNDDVSTAAGNSQQCDPSNQTGRSASILNDAMNFNIDPKAMVQAHFDRLPLQARQSVLVQLLSSSPAWLRANVLRQSSVTLRVPKNTWTLLELYFSFTNCWLPVVQRQDILKTFHSYRDDELCVDPSSPEAEKHAALWALIAYASFQEQGLRSDGHVSEAHDLTPQMIFEIARSLVVPNPLRLGRGHVQAMVILSLINAGCGRSLAARKLVGDAIRASSSISQAKSDTSPGQRRDNDITLGKDEGIMMSCFIVDTLLSSLYSLPPQLTPADVANIQIIDTDRLEEYEPWYNRTGLQGGTAGMSDARRGPQYSFTIFTELFKLMCILHDFICADPDDATSVSHMRRQNFVKLDQWHSNLPITCQLSLPLDQQSKLQVTPQQLHLRLIYSFVGMQCSDRTTASPSYHASATHIDLEHVSLTITAPLLLTYADVFGTSYMPSLYHIVVQQCSEEPLLPRSLRSALETVDSALRQIWDLENVPALPLGSNGPEINLQPQIQSGRQNEASHPLTNGWPKQHPTQRYLQSEITSNQRSTGMERAPLPTQFTNTSAAGPFGNSLGSADYLTIPVEYSGTEAAGPELVDEIAGSGNLLYRPLSNTRKRRLPDTEPTLSTVPEMRPTDDYRFMATNNIRGSTQGYGMLQSTNPYSSQAAASFNAGPSFDIGSSVAGNYDLDALFNELAPLDHGESQQAFMQNLGISGDLDFDLDTFFT